ncbi:flagellar FlbD family protein [Niallia sp. 01092]|uniref:flagellar FlbD family protein n=1 Tax=unclassified Niallia TaxID=2837522 RepID=UPI003FD139A0
MISVTRLNGKKFKLNALFIESIESFPDTTITLANGNKYVVKESEQQIVELVKDYYQTVNLFGLPNIGENCNEE